jgi:predicted metal-dependent phosphotriesterase family hydrolase
VRGDISPDDLQGVTLTHEHLITAPLPRLRDGDDLLLDDESRATHELTVFRQAGGAGLVELTTAEFGRDPAALRRISEASDIHVISTTGHVSEDYWRGALDLDNRAEDAMVEEFVGDLEAGFPDATGPTVRAGVIKAGTSMDAVTPTEERILRAAARAQVATGAPITTHTTAGTMAPDQARILLDAGADPTHVCLGHLDRRLDYDQHESLARQGFYLGYDCMSKDWYEPDSRRVADIARLVAAGFVNRICIAGDLARRSQLVAWGGGPGYSYVPWRIAPWLRRVGLGQDEVEQLLVLNPAQSLTWQ